MSKVKVSGGGRCNVTNARFNISEMAKNYPRGSAFLKSALHQFSAADTVNWFAERGVVLKTEPDGRMFPEANTSQAIIDCLLREVNRYHIEIMMNAGVTGIEKGNESQHELHKIKVNLADNRTMLADAVCVASGGYSKSAGYEWITGTGHTIEQPVPSLFTFNIPHNSITDLMGVSVNDAVIKMSGNKLQQRGPILITHWGLSGPAVLKLSAWGARALADNQYDFKITVNWLPDYHEQSIHEKMQSLRFELASQKIYNRNPFGLPSRLWEFLLKESGIGNHLRWADLKAKDQHKLNKFICAHEFHVKGKTTFKDEFVTAGGITLPEINTQTMESKIVDGLFFAGEVINVDGITGGYNFQNAWTTGWIAASGITAKLSCSHQSTN